MEITGKLTRTEIGNLARASFASKGDSDAVELCDWYLVGGSTAKEDATIAREGRRFNVDQKEDAADVLSLLEAWGEVFILNSARVRLGLVQALPKRKTAEAYNA